MKKNYTNKNKNYITNLNSASKLSLILFVLFALLFKNELTAQTVQTYTASGSWVCPTGVTSVKVETWGAGGGGGYARTTNRGAGGGGGGGEYTYSNTITVTPGTTYYFRVGAGGIGGTAAGVAANAGESSCFSTAINCGGTILTSANGGLAGSSVTTNTSGAGGAGGTGGTFTTGGNFSGGDGAAGVNGNGAAFGGGGGGGGGSTTQAGGNASGKTGGIGGNLGGGNGGDGASNTNGSNGILIGGGGAGGHRNNTNNGGSDGANGQVRLTYTIPAPSNDLCSAAASLTVNPNLTCTISTNGTTLGATQSQVGCSGNADDDVWYSFVATTNAHIITVTPTTLSNVVFEVFSGTCGGSLTSLGCIDATSGATAESTILTGLTAGNTYYIRVYSFAFGTNEGTFSICVTTQPACIAPASQATGFTLGTITSTAVPASFSGTANGYLVIQSLTNTPPSQPVNGTTYTAGTIATLGSGLTFIQSSASTSIPGTGLVGNTKYYYFIYNYNNTACSGGPIYNTSGPLTGNGTTCPAVPNSVSVSGITPNGFTLNWAYPTGGSSSAITYTVQITTNAAYTANIPGSPFTIADPTVIKVVTGLASNTIYYYRILASNGCSSTYVTGNTTTLQPGCIAPASQATGFTLGTITSTAVPASFSGTANGYLVIQSLTNTPPSQPVNGTTYTAGTIATLGSGLTFIQSSTSTSIPGTGLAGNTKYYYFIYNYNNTACSGGPIYNTSGPLTGNGTTCPAVSNSVSVSGITPNGFTLNWAYPTGGASSAITYTVQITTNAAYTANIPGSPFTIADPTVIKVVTGLASNTIYYYRILASNGCSSTYVTGNTTTLQPACITPASQATGFTLGTITSTAIPASFSGTANGYLVIRSLTNTLPSQPVNGTTYTAGTITTLGSGLTFIQSSASTSIPGTGLAGNTKYYYFIYNYNNTACSGGPIYNTSGPLTGSGTTCPAVPNLVTVSSNSSSGFTLNWVYPTGGASAAITYTLQITTNAAYTANIPGSPFTIADPTTTKVVTGLASNTIYYYRILASNGCNSAYVTGNNTTLLPTCIAPINQASGFTLGAVNTTSVPASFSGTANGYLVIQSLTNTLPSQPVNGTLYTAANIATLGSGLTFIQSGASTSIPGTGLVGNTKYYYFIYAYNTTSCFGGPFYNTLGPLTGNGTTCPDIPYSVATTGNTTSSFTLNWAAPSGGAAAAISYTIQVTTNAGYTANIAGSPFTVASPTTSLSFTSLTANTTYYYRILANNGCSSAYVTGSTYTGYCLSSSTANTTYINNFSTTGGIANISNNGSGYSAGGYGNFTAKIVSQQPYGTVNFSSTYVGGTFGFNIWVDWNDDLDFDDSGEKVYGSSSYNSNNTGNFTVPAFASVGNHRMRIRADFWATNPSACGAITNGETEDYTFTVVALPCSGNPSNVSASAISFTTATINWTAAVPAPASGYQYYYSTSGTAPVPATVASGTTGAGILSANLSGLVSGTLYNVWVRSNCGANQGVWVGPLNFLTVTAPPVTTGASFCQGGSGTISAVASCTNLVNLGTTINGSWDAGSDPRAIRPLIFIANSPTCQFDAAGLSSNYNAIDFQVSVTGNYDFTMAATTAYDGMGYIVVNPFTPGLCGSGTWVVGDDDSGPTTYEPEMNATLTAGVTYTLISTLYSASSITLTNTFQWNVTGPPGGYIAGVSAGSVQWYTVASGGTPIGTGTPFNPVGVSGSGLVNTNTPGTTTFYAACPSNPSVRTPVDFVINGPTGAISGSGSICGGGSTSISIALTGVSPWTFTYTDGTTPITVTGNTTNPYVFSVSPSAPTTYTLTALNDANCSALVTNLTGSAIISGAKTWNGTTDSDWNTATNWSPSTVPSATDCVIIPFATNSPIISGSAYDAYAYSLTVLSGGVLLINSSNSLTVTDVVNVDPSGQLYIKDTASLIQVNNTANIGSIDLERITQPMYRFDYTYWGCPVTLASNFTLGNLSPNTLSDKYFSWTPTIGNSFGNWFFESAATVMNPIKGYIVRAPQTFSPSPGTKVPYTANFIGTPNNGAISCPIYHGTLGVGNNNDKYNLLGNPYPSAVDAQLFLSDPSNTPIIDGTIYFWTHNSAPSTSYVDPFYGDFVINYSSSDYASWNSLGAVGFRGSAAASGGSAPNGYIAAGQGFFTKSTGTAPSGNSVVFKNSMRVSGNNSQFFRNSVRSLPSRNRLNSIEKHRIWLNVINNTGFFNQILVGYAENATAGWDRDFDGVSISENSGTTFYSIIPDKNLVIQGRALPFSDDDQVPLGFKSSAQDTFAMRIDHFDGLFENQNIYIEDKLLNIIHDLKQSPYLFASPSGTFNDRFVLRYTNTTLSTQNPNATIGLISLITNEKLVVQASEKMRQIEVFDMTGKLIQQNILAEQLQNFETNFIFADGIYMAKIHFENGSIVTQKLINKK